MHHGRLVGLLTLGLLVGLTQARGQERYRQPVYVGAQVCASCHEGEGLATDVETSHGNWKFIETQVRLQPFVQGACVKCHMNYQNLKGAETASKGRALFEEHGCIGCHSHLGKFAGAGGGQVAPAFCPQCLNLSGFSVERDGN